jgi:hypothetical protein
MSESGSRVSRYLADLELVNGVCADMSAGGQSTQRLHEVNILAKKLEMKLTAARLAQAEYCFEVLSARRDFLEARCAQGRASYKEMDALDWASQALPLNALTVVELEAELDRHKRELDSLMKVALQAA